MHAKLTIRQGIGYSLFWHYSNFDEMIIGELSWIQKFISDNSTQLTKQHVVQGFEKDNKGPAKAELK